MSLLPSSTFAGPSTAEALWAAAGAVGPGGGVTQLVAGEGILLDPGTGDGVVTITATGGAGGGGVDSITSGGAGLGVSSPTGSVVLTNTGVTSLIAGPGVTVSGSIGAVTVSSPTASTIAPSAGSANLEFLAPQPGTQYGVPNNANIITGAFLKFAIQQSGVVQFTASFTRPLPGAPDPWSFNDGYTVMLRNTPVLTSGDFKQANMTVNFNPSATPPCLIVTYNVSGVWDTTRPATDGPLISLMRIKGIPVPV